MQFVHQILIDKIGAAKILMNLPDLNAYVKVPNNPLIKLTRFEIKDYPARTTPFIIQVTSSAAQLRERGQSLNPLQKVCPWSWRLAMLSEIRRQKYPLKRFSVLG
jgi:hypothetical protein